jgi:hypothetical protein
MAVLLPARRFSSQALGRLAGLIFCSVGIPVLATGTLLQNKRILDRVIEGKQVTPDFFGILVVHFIRKGPWRIHVL